MSRMTQERLDGVKAALGDRRIQKRDAAKAIADAAEADGGRNLTEDERAKFDLLMATVEELDGDIAAAEAKFAEDNADAERRKALGDMFEDIEPPAGEPQPKGEKTPARPAAPMTLGEAFVMDKKFQEFVGRHLTSAGEVSRAKFGETPRVDLGPASEFFGTKALFTTNPDATPNLSTDAMGGHLLLPQRRPGIIEKPQEELGLLGCINFSQVNSKVQEWITLERGANNAAKHTEAKDKDDADAKKPYSGPFTLKVHSITLECLAHMFCATRCSLASWDLLRSIIDREGRRGLQEAINSQLLTGDTATSPTDVITGILAQADKQVLEYIEGSTVSDMICSAVTALRTQNLRGRKVLMNPVDLEGLIKESAGDSCCGFRYANPLTGQTSPTIWGLEIVDTMDVPPGTAIVFDPSAWQGFTFGQLEAHVTDSHEDHFAKNIIDFLFEVTVGVGFNCPEAFVCVSLKGK